MNFVDTLRSARQSRVSVLHEFWTQFNPSQPRVHAFFEGHDDVSFFVPLIEQRMPRGHRLYRYRCDSKARVFEAFTEITTQRPAVQSVLFFVDKDLDDILGLPWPTDPRIFVTDVYSVENYLVTQEVLLRFFRDSVRLAGVNFGEDAIARQFDAQLRVFHERLLTVMAWILISRRAGQRLNLNNVRLGKMWRFVDGVLSTVPGSRIDELHKAAGLTHRTSFTRLREVRRELGRIPPKRVVRGKFEAWFLVEFWKHVVEHLQLLATEAGGKCQSKIDLRHGNIVPTLAQYVDAPQGLELFLHAHFPGKPSNVVPHTSGTQKRGTWWQRLLGIPPHRPSA